MASRAEELAKLLGTGTGFRPSYRNTYTSSEGGISRYIWPVLAVLLVLVLILLVVHYTVTPIFTFSFGDRGLIPLARANDGQLVWTKGPVAADLSANVLRILPNSFTVQMDIYVESERAVGKFDRVLFYRALRPVTPDNTLTLMKQYPETNLVVRLLAETNDLVVSAVTLADANNLETASLESTPTILNVPIRQPFRLTVILLPQVLEVYMNGKLYGTKTFRYTLKSTPSYFFGPPDLYRNSTRIMNVQYWDRALNAREVKAAGPALPDVSLFGPLAPPGGTC
jgi:uncharacterized protein (UPF0333 family)